MKLLTPSDVLFYYDGVQIFEGKDSIGGHYIGLLIESDGGRDRYVVAGVEPERLWQFKAGRMDLRTLLAGREDQQCFIGSPAGGLSQPFALSAYDRPLTETNWLPEPGFLLHTAGANAEVILEARGRNNLVIELEVDPPESIHDHRIRADTLSRLLTNMQAVIKHAYGWAYRELPPAVQNGIDRAKAPLLDVVVPAGAGSFKLTIEAAQKPGLFGQSELTRALENLDHLLERVADPQETLARVQAHRGHFAAAYLRLMKFLVNAQCGLRYTWAEPSFVEPRSRGVSSAQAGPIVSALETVASLGVETVHLIGSLRKADVNGSWRIETEDREVTGKIREGGPSLAGLKIEGRYHFTCEEILEETEGTGREQRTLYLLHHEPA